MARLIAGAGLAVALSQACPARADSAGELRSAARQIGGELAAQKSAGHFDAATQQRFVERLGKLGLAYIDLSDKAAFAGSESRERDALLGAYQAVTPPLEEIYDQNSRTLERSSKQVIDADGDLEALYDTQPWKDAQVVASQALYFLNWLHYYGARLHDGEARKQLLEKARNGFGEFAVGDRRTELLVESLLGRGLTHLELGDTDFAVHDLQAVVEDPQASAERKSKARLALLDAYARAGRVDDVVRLSDQILGTGGRAEDNLVRFIRIRALLAAVKNTPGAAAERYRQQALTQMEQLRRAGGGWEEKVAALAETGIADPEKWSANATSAFAKWELAKLLAQKGDYKQAAPLLEGFLSSGDAEVRAHQGEAHYLLGLAKFQAGQHQEAADHLDAALKEPNASYSADAAYVRFKALEALVAKSAGADVAPQYEQALRTYVAQYPDHKSAFEAQFRLGELLQAQRQFADASQAYAKVKGDPGFELRAQFATVQCQFELLQADEQRAAGPRRTALLSAIGAGLQKFDQQAANYQERKAPSDQVPLAQMRAKAAIMSAVHSTLQPEPHDAAILAALNGFEKTYPDQQDLFPQVVRLRLTADQRLGRFADAEAEIRARAPVLASLGAAAVEELAVGFVREGARRNGKGDAVANKAAQQVALRLYELLVSENEGAGKARLTLARLYENTGDLSKSSALYSEVLKADATSLAALRGLGRIAEAQNRPAEALAHWQRLTKAVRPGDVPWYEGSYEVARLTQAAGKKREACELLDQLKPAMPGLSDADLRKKLDSLYQQTCR